MYFCVCYVFASLVNSRQCVCVDFLYVNTGSHSKNKIASFQNKEHVTCKFLPTDHDKQIHYIL